MGMIRIEMTALGRRLCSKPRYLLQGVTPQMLQSSWKTQLLGLRFVFFSLCSVVDYRDLDVHRTFIITNVNIIYVYIYIYSIDICIYLYIYISSIMNIFIQYMYNVCIYSYITMYMIYM